MVKKLSDLLKDRRYFSQEQEQAIHKAAQEEAKKYTKNESISQITENLKNLLEEHYTMKDLFGYLQPDSDINSDKYVLADNNEAYIYLEDDKIIAKNEIGGHVQIELTPEICKNKELLLKTLKDAGILHKETVDICRWDKLTDDMDFMSLLGVVESDNENIHIMTQSGGRGTYVTLIKNKSEDAIQNAINAAGLNISNYEVIKETSKGTLVAATVRPYNNKKAFLIKDGKGKNAGIGALLKIIKEM